MFDTHLETSECLKEYSLKWTLNDFSKLPIDKEFECPPLKPLLGHEWKLSFLKNGEELFLFLGSKSKREMTPEICLSIYDCSGKRWHYQELSETVKTGERINILRYSRSFYQNLHCLKDDLVIIICDFEIREVLTTDITEDKILTLQKYDSRLKLCADLKNLCDDKQHADVTFTVDGSQVFAHKAILCARSPVFDKMFRQPMKEQEQGSVKIDDVDLPVFKELVDYLYAGKMEIQDDIATTKALYYAADKYEVMDLRKQCADILLSMLTTENAFGIVAIADRHQDDFLKKSALTFISENSVQ